LRTVDALEDRAVLEGREQTLTALVEQIYPPSDWGSGARELGVAVTVRALADNPAGRGEDSYRGEPFSTSYQPEFGWQWRATPLEALDHGLDAVQSWSYANYGVSFADLDEGTQIRAIEALEADAMAGFELVAARAFFDLLSGWVFDALFVVPTLGSYSLDAVWARLGLGGSAS
jgi:Gluconate 2-dehydrogenase subunit 3